MRVWFLVVLFVAQIAMAGTQYLPTEGDVIFQSLPKADLVEAIEGVTQSSYSHCGVVIKHNHQWHVIESIGMVRITPFEDFVARGVGGRYAAYRLRDKYRSKAVLKKYKEKMMHYLGHPYDFRYRMDDEYIMKGGTHLKYLFIGLGYIWLQFYTDFPQILSPV